MHSFVEAVDYSSKSDFSIFLIENGSGKDGAQAVAKGKKTPVEHQALSAASRRLPGQGKTIISIWTGEKRAGVPQNAGLKSKSFLTQKESSVKI